MVLIVNLAIAAFLAGLTLFAQIVHYPLFTFIDKKSFIEYSIHQLKKTNYLFYIPMLAEGLFSILFLFDYPSLISELVPIICLGISTAVWLISFNKITPLLDKLNDEGLNNEIVEQLVKLNWIRTICWTLKVLILIYCMGVKIFVV